MELKIGLLFTGKYFTGTVEVLEIKRQTNELEVRCKNTDHTSSQWWFETWDLGVTERGFSSGDYFITPKLAEQNDLNDPIMKPSLFLQHPLGSITKESDLETIAHNIMAILSRTGDKFRDLSWEEYEAERKKDGNFTMTEQTYFDQLAYLAKGSFRAITSFSPVWRSAYHRKSNESKKQKA